MKLVSAKQKMTTTGSSERINFSNEIDFLTVSSSDVTFKLSDFNSDIIYLNHKEIKTNVTIHITCNRPYRKYTFIALNTTTGSNIIFDFQGDGYGINKYSNESDPVFKAGTCGIIELYQIAGTTIHLVQHTLAPIKK